MPRPTYRPPPMNQVIWIRDPEMEPEIPRAADGTLDYSAVPEWGVMAYANRRDQGQFLEASEGVNVRVGRSVFTIHYRSGVKPTSQVLEDGVLYDLVGPAVERGGPNANMKARYLELHCERRTGKGT